jgi:hypothetical protein
MKVLLRLNLELCFMKVASPCPACHVSQEGVATRRAATDKVVLITQFFREVNKFQIIMVMLLHAA